MHINHSNCPNINRCLDRGDRVAFVLWAAIFAISAIVVIWAMVHFGPRTNHVSATGTYTSTIHTSAPCARSMRQVRLNHGAEDDLCASWFGPNGWIIVGPLSDAPAYAHIVGGG